MFLLECRGANESFSKLSKSFLLNKNWFETNNQDEDDYDTVSLFDNLYHKGSTLNSHPDDLFAFARKHFQFLNRAARNDAVPTVNANYSNFVYLRESIVDFFLHVQETMDDFIESEDSADEAFLKALRNHLTSYRLMIGSLDSIPDYIVQNCSSENGNRCSFASFHMFHSYLELFWLNFIISLKLSLKKNNTNEQLFDNETEPIGYVYEDKMNSNFDADVETEIEWFIYNLISLSSRSLEKSKFKTIFPCNCVREIWLALQTSIDRLSEENKCSHFWHYFNKTIKQHLLNKTPQTAAFACNNPYKMPPIGSSKSIEFALYLLLKLARLRKDESADGGNPKSNFDLLEHIVKSITQSERTVSEEEMRAVMKQIVQLMNLWPEPKNEVVTLLWEYFHKRLNSAFAISGKDDSGNLLQNFSICDAVSDLKASVNPTETVPLQTLRTENSFYLFNSLLAMHLNKCTLNNLPSLCQKVKGRILPKFTANKIAALNEYGLKHFSSIFLAMGLATNVEDMFDKLQELLLQLPFNELQLNKKYVVMKTHLIILWLYVEKGMNIKNAALPVKRLITSIGNSRDSETMNFLKMILNSCLDIIDASTGFQNDEYVLIDTWIPKYLTVCNINDVYNTLDRFSTLVSKLQILCSYEIHLSDSVLCMLDAFFAHIFASAKALYFNGSSALQIAELVFNFGKLALDSGVVAEKYGSFETVLKSFLDCENANDRVSRHYITLLLQDDYVLQKLEGDNSACQSLIINSWVKCSLSAKDTSSDDDTHLILLINQLSEFSVLNITPSMEDREHRNLCKFFYALKLKWDGMEDFNKRMDFKKNANIYLKGVDKILANIVKNPTTADGVIQMFMTIGTLFLHCSPIIYTRSDPTCLMHLFIGTSILPHQLFMEKKVHHYVAAGICKSWYLFVRGFHRLDYKYDPYVAKAMKDMIVQYLPFFAEVTVTAKDRPFHVPYRMIPDECSEDLELEKYVLDVIASIFVTCRGKQSHPHATRALCILLHLCNTSNTNLLLTLTSSTLLAVFEQLMFSDGASTNRKVAVQILNSICNGHDRIANGVDIRDAVRDILAKTCAKHLAFNSAPFFRLALQVAPALGQFHMNIFVSTLKMEIVKVEKMRGVGYDQGLRNGLGEIESAVSKCQN